MISVLQKLTLGSPDGRYSKVSVLSLVLSQVMSLVPSGEGVTHSPVTGPVPSPVCVCMCGWVTP